MTYYNTTQAIGKELQSFIESAETQDQKVLILFRNYLKLTPSEAWNLSGLKNTTPITSIRRAITNLTNEGLLIRTEDKKEGIYGRPESVYELVQSSADGQTRLF